MEKRSSIARRAISINKTNISFVSESIVASVLTKDEKKTESNPPLFQSDPSLSSTDLSQTVLRRFVGDQVNISFLNSIDKAKIVDEIDRIRQRENISDQQRKELFDTAIAMDVPKLARKLVAESSISCGLNDTKSESPSMFCTETVSVDCDEDAAFCKALAEVERTRNRMLARASKQIATSDAMCRSSPQRTVFGNKAYNCSAQGLVGIKEAEIYQQDAKSNSDIVAQDVADAIAMLIDDEDQAAYPRKCEYDGIKSQLSFEADTKFNVGDYYCEPASAFSRDEVAHGIACHDSADSSWSWNHRMDMFGSQEGEILLQPSLSHISGSYSKTDSLSYTQTQKKKETTLHLMNSADSCTASTDVTSRSSSRSRGLRNANYHMKMLVSSSLCDWLSTECSPALPPTRKHPAYVSSNNSIDGRAGIISQIGANKKSSSRKSQSVIGCGSGSSLTGAPSSSQRCLNIADYSRSSFARDVSLEMLHQPRGTDSPCVKYRLDSSAQHCNILGCRDSRTLVEAKDDAGVSYQLRSHYAEGKSNCGDDEPSSVTAMKRNASEARLSIHLLLSRASPAFALDSGQGVLLQRNSSLPADNELARVAYNACGACTESVLQRRQRSLLEGLQRELGALSACLADTRATNTFSPDIYSGPAEGTANGRHRIAVSELDTGVLGVSCDSDSSVGESNSSKHIPISGVSVVGFSSDIHQVGFQAGAGTGSMSPFARALGSAARAGNAAGQLLAGLMHERKKYR